MLLTLRADRQGNFSLWTSAAEFQVMAARQSTEQLDRPRFQANDFININDTYVVFDVLCFSMVLILIFPVCMGLCKGRFDGADQRTPFEPNCNGQSSEYLCIVGLLEVNRLIDDDRELSRKYFYPPLTSVANNSCDLRSI